MDTYIPFMDRYPARLTRRRGNARLTIGLLGMAIATLTCIMGPGLTPAGATVTAGREAPLTAMPS